jgi:death-on-curing protein
MNYILLSPQAVRAIHDTAIESGDLTGQALDKSLEATVARVENRLIYGLLGDQFDLAAAYAVTIARGHCFNDGNKRTAFRSMQVCLDLQGIAISLEADRIGPIIVKCAEGLIDEAALAEWLRCQPNVDGTDP